MKTRRVRLNKYFLPSAEVNRVFRVNNRPTKDLENDYELVVSFQYGLDEKAISRIAGLNNYDTGIMLATGRRDLMFPCGHDDDLVYGAAKRLIAADHFGALEVKISCPTVKKGKDSFTPWRNAKGKLIEMVKHRKLSPIVKFAKAPKRRKPRYNPVKGKPKNGTGRKARTS